MPHRLRKLTKQEAAEEVIYRRQLMVKWGKIIAELEEEGRI